LVSQATGVAVAVGNGASSQPTISGDGQFVAFTSLASTLALTPGGSGAQIFSRDTQANTTSLVSQAAVGGNAGNGASSQPTISADGGFAAFSSVSTNLGAAGGNQIYVRALP
jgi:Tol biopolymer transport system component